MKFENQFKLMKRVNPPHLLDGEDIYASLLDNNGIYAQLFLTRIISALNHKIEGCIYSFAQK